MEEISKIYKTTDYDMFKYVKGNRLLNSQNCSKLYKSMSEEQLIIPICVNEKYQVIDGQHRLMVCQDLGLPVYFYIVEGYNINQVKRANIVSSNWKKEDYLHMFISSDNEAYAKFQELHKNRNISIANLLKVFAIAQGKNNAKINYEFMQGDLTLDKEKYVIEFLDNLEDFKFFPEYKTAQFISAFLKLNFKPDYVHERMKSKLETHQHTIKKSNTSDEYLSILCNKIYSYGVTKDPIYYSVDRKKFHD